MARVLVVDDDASIRLVIVAVLADEGYQVDEASDGHAALEAIGRQRPDVILLDLRMPGMDGHEFLRRYRERYASPAPVIVLSAGHDPGQHAADVGADGYLPKPFDLDALVERVSALAQVRRPRWTDVAGEH